jgi:phosphoglucosamine mutase
MSRLFGTDGIRGIANEHPMLPEIALQLGKALAYILRKNTQNKSGHRYKIIIGKDTRISCYMIEEALSAGICSMGVDAYMIGPMPTPAVSFLTRAMRCDAGVVISASHNPFMDNGIKIFSSDGFKLPDSKETEIEELLFSNELEYERPKSAKIGKAFRIEDARGRYIEFLKSTLPKELNLENLRIACDCANGATYKIAPVIYQELGAKVFSLGVNPDGLNINKNCGSQYTRYLRRTVLKNKLDMGISFDGDGDRVIFIDDKGNIIDGDYLLAISGIEMIKNGNLRNNTVVGTVMSNIGLEISLKKVNGKLIRTQVGDRYVVESMLKNNFNLGGEQSGHLIYLDKTTTGDGILSSLQILSIIISTGKSLRALTSVLQKYPQVLISVPIKKKKHISEIPKLHKLVNSIEEDLGNNGRILVRHSGTENKARIMIEGEDEKKITEYAKAVARIIKKEMA